MPSSSASNNDSDHRSGEMNVRFVARQLGHARPLCLSDDATIDG